ncbi:O-antigen ligase family protein [Mesorhizobium sp. 10J20-29]
MRTQESRFIKNLLGFVLLLALVIGGGTGQGLYTDFVIQIAVVIAAAVSFTSAPASRAAPAGLVIVAMIAVAGAVQILPLPSFVLGLQIPLSASPDASREFVSQGVGQTIESLIFALSVVLFAIALMRLSMDQLCNLLPFFFVGLYCNLLASIMQFSIGDDVRVNSLLPYSISSGFFANVNHFSSLLFISIPLLVYYGILQNRALISVVSISLVLLTLLAAGSRAGMALGLAISVLSFGFLIWRSRLGSVSVLVVAALVTVFGYTSIEKIRAEDLDAAFGRAEFARTAIAGIRENLVFGVGYGNFAKAYQSYEDKSMIYSQYVNHAHNDYLEILFEGGLIGISVVIVYVIMVIVRTRIALKYSISRAALLSIVFIMVHSLVDYPLRTMSIALSFAFLNAIYFHRSLSSQSAQQSIAAMPEEIDVIATAAEASQRPSTVELS